ncbi:MAG TPA: Uma2 family endonuclease [Bryobacteraceae bacterium]|nr:Uma2 family endonuclease [Bryobacteraceae bacterium]
MATGTLISVEEYLRTYYDPDMEYVDGQLVERSVGQRRHSRLQSLLVMELGKREQERGFEVLAEQRIVTQPGRRYRVPDICVKAVPDDPAPILERPDLTIEILSPDDTLMEAAEKCAEYFQSGIPANWVCDPYRKALYSYGPEGLRLVNPPILENELTGPIDFAAIFAELDLSGKRR